MSKLKKWLLINKCYTKDSSKASHLLLDGGMLSINIKQNIQFMKYYSKEFNNHYIVEKKTDIYKFPIDIDYIDKIVLEKNDIVKISIIIQDILYEFYKRKFRLIICETQSKEIIMNDDTYIKTGIHIIADELYIDNKDSKDIRIAIIIKLKEHFPNRPNFNTWESIIDLAIYKHCGLRIIGSKKQQPCKNCKKMKEQCVICGGTRKIEDNRIYLPTIIIDTAGEIDDETLDELNKDLYKAVKITSIRTKREKKENIKCWPSWLNEIPEEPGHNYIKTNEIIERSNLNKIDKEYKPIVSTIHLVLPDVYKNMNIINIFKYNKGEYYIVQTNSRFCMNIWDEHDSNHIYFVINKNGLYQKCLCPKPILEGPNGTKKREFGYCSNYTSDIRPLGIKVQKMLFPEPKNNMLTFTSDNSIKTCEYLLQTLECEIMDKQKFEKEKESKNK